MPPTVVRQVDEKDGIVQLYIDNISKYDHKYLNQLSSIEKSNKTKLLKQPFIENLKINFPDINRNDFISLKEYTEKMPLYYFEYKEAYWIKDIKKYHRIHKHLLPFNKKEDYSSQTIKKLKRINNYTIKKLLVNSFKKDIYINGILYRKKLILEEMKRLKEKDPLLN